MEDAMRRRGKLVSRQAKKLRVPKARLRRIEALEPRQMLNAAPVANDDSYSVAEDTVLASAGSVLANDSDADSDPLTAVLVSGPQHGTLNLKTDGTFTYTPAADFAGADTFTYAARDVQLAQDQATVTINVIGENEPPTVNNQVFSVVENSPNGTALGTVVATDPDAGDVLTYTWTDSSGAFAIDSNGKITVADSSKVDFETKATINLVVSVSDNEGATDTATITINVINANDAPTVASPLADVAVAEEANATVINVSGVFADQDQDALSFSVTSDNPSLVTPSISGSELKLTYNFNQFGSANITLTAHDGKGGTASDTFAVNVSNVNDPPIANNDTFTTPVGMPITANALANDVDPDGDTLTTFLSSVPSSGMLSFQSNGSFTYTPNAGFNGTDAFTYTATDGNGGTDTAFVAIFVDRGPNRPPNANNDAFTTPHNTAVSGNVLANDSEPDGDMLIASLDTSPAHGNVALNFDGSFSYLPNGGFVGADSFTYKASDGLGGFDLAKVEINVTLPTVLDASDDNFVLPEDSIVTGNLLANDVDPEGDKFSLISTTAPSSGSLSTDSAGNFTYTPLANYFGADSFSYTIQDTSGSTATATVTLVFTAVNEVDAVNDTFGVGANTKFSVAAPGVLSNDIDPDTNPEHKIAIIGVIPAMGTGTGGVFDIRADGSFDFTPAVNFVGTAFFTYTIQDSAGAKDTATVLIDVSQPNFPPDAKNDNASVLQDSKDNFIAVLANDTDANGDPIIVSGVTAPANGTVTIVPSDGQTAGGVRYTPNPGFRGADSFTYLVSDGRGGSNNATVVVTVAPPVNPDASDDFFTLSEDTVLIGNLLANDFDLEGDALTVTSATSPSSGSLIVNSAGNFSYMPSGNFVGDASFTYTMTDGHGTSDTASVTIRVTNLNDIPEAKDDAFTALPEASNTINVLANDIDSDLANPVHAKFNTDPPDALRVVSVGTAINGQVILSPGGVVSYSPNEGFNGTDSFTYTISDRGQDGIAGTSDDKTDTGTVTVTVFDNGIGVDARNDTYTVNEDTIRNALDVLKNDVDSEADFFKVTAVTQAAKGIVEIGTNGANVLYTPDPNFAGTDTFTYTITDDTGFSDTAKVTVTVTGTIDPPVATNDTATVAAGSQGKVIDVLANDIDPDGSKLTITGVTQGMAGTVAIAAGGATVTYTPNHPGFSGSDSFTYTITDLEGASDTATVQVTVGTAPGPAFTGSDGEDVFYVRRDAAGTKVQVFANDTGTGTPVFSAPFDALPGLTFDTLGGNDRLIVDAINGDPLPENAGFIAYKSGTGANTLTVQNGMARIDSTVAAEGSLDTTVAAGAELTTHRFYQNGLILGDGANAVILQNGTNAATSVVTSLAIGAGATLDINDNALIVNYTGASPAAAIRAKIVAGRGGAGIGNGAWTGAGITSSTVAAANATEPNALSVGYTENATLPLGAYTSFRGESVDETAVLIAPTRTADANLDGVVNDNDVTIIGASFAPGVPQPQWALGDFDYNGFVDDDDVTLLGAFYDPAASPLAPPPVPLAEDFAGATELIDVLAHWIAEQPASQSANPVDSAGSIGRKSRAADRFWAYWEN
jgi:VCBS repeat-containing protein